MSHYALSGVPIVRCPAGVEPAQNDLAARVADGEREAFVLVYRAHCGEVLAFAERVLGSRFSAEDVVHDVFLALPSALRSFRGDCSLRTYLLSIAVRFARTRYRAAVRRRKHEDRAALESRPWTAPSPDEGSERRELARLLGLALDTLPVDQRVAFVLCEVEERTSVEVAAILGENASTIRARVFHAKKRLREELSRVAAEDHGQGAGGGRP